MVMEDAARISEKKMWTRDWPVFWKKVDQRLTHKHIYIYRYVPMSLSLSFSIYVSLCLCLSPSVSVCLVAFLTEPSHAYLLLLGETQQGRTTTRWVTFILLSWGMALVACNSILATLRTLPPHKEDGELFNSAPCLLLVAFQATTVLQGQCATRFACHCFLLAGLFKVSQAHDLTSSKSDS